MTAADRGETGRRRGEGGKGKRRERKQIERRTGALGRAFLQLEWEWTVWCKPKHDVSWAREKPNWARATQGAEGRGANKLGGWLAEWLSGEVSGEWWVGCG